jgi:hypothetical protein
MDQAESFCKPRAAGDSQLRSGFSSETDGALRLLIAWMDLTIKDDGFPKERWNVRATDERQEGTQ